MAPAMTMAVPINFPMPHAPFLAASVAASDAATWLCGALPLSYVNALEITWYLCICVGI